MPSVAMDLEIDEERGGYGQASKLVKGVSVVSAS